MRITIAGTEDEGGEREEKMQQKKKDTVILVPACRNSSACLRTMAMLGSA